MSRKQIGLRMKDETRDQLERVRGGLSRTDYIEGAVLAQIARDLKKAVTVGVDIPGEAITIGPKVDIFEDGPGGPIYIWVCDQCGQPVNQWEQCNSGIHVGPNGTGTIGKPIKSTILAGLVGERSDTPLIQTDERIPPNMAVSCGSPYVLNASDAEIPDNWLVRSSAESKANVLPVPKKAVKGRK